MVLIRLTCILLAVASLSACANNQLAPFKLSGPCAPNFVSLGTTF